MVYCVHVTYDTHSPQYNSHFTSLHPTNDMRFNRQQLTSVHFAFFVPFSLFEEPRPANDSAAELSRGRYCSPHGVDRHVYSGSGLSLTLAARHRTSLVHFRLRVYRHDYGMCLHASAQIHTRALFITSSNTHVHALVDSQRCVKKSG